MASHDAHMDGGRRRRRHLASRARRPMAVDAGGRRSSAPPTTCRGASRDLAARRSAAPNVAHLVVATRGVWTAQERRAAARRLHGLARRVTVLSDVEAALPRSHRRSRGTARPRGHRLHRARPRSRAAIWVRAGGLGPLFGDGGSAFALGRDWLAAAHPFARAPARRERRTPSRVSRHWRLESCAVATRRWTRATRCGSREPRRWPLDMRAAVQGRAPDAGRSRVELGGQPPRRPRLSRAGLAHGARPRPQTRPRRADARARSRPPRASLAGADASLPAPASPPAPTPPGP